MLIAITHKGTIMFTTSHSSRSSYVPVIVWVERDAIPLF